VPHHKSAKKRVRQTTTKTSNNKSKVSRTKGLVKAIRLAISENKKDEALKLLPTVQSMFGRLAKNNIIKPNTAARKTARLTNQISKL